ncbi:hypothetical protein D3C87_1524410 [compost metagenome]
MLNSVNRLEDISEWLLTQSKRNANEVGAASVEYLQMFGHIAYGWLWARMAAVAKTRRSEDEDFYSAKLATAEFFFRRLLPRTQALEASIRAGSSSLFSLSEDQF